MMFALHSKLIWSLLKGKSLWAKYIEAKYKRGRDCICSSGSSHIWKALFQRCKKVKEHEMWILGKGNKSFWLDNWCGEILYGPSPYDVNLLVKNVFRTFFL